VLEQALQNLKTPPKVWLQASTATIYSHSLYTNNDEYTGIIGGCEPNAPEKWRFSIDVARSWEGEFTLVHAPQTRKVLLRSAMTMSPDKGGIFDYLLWLVRMGLGGTGGSGKQYISWIHYQDFIRAVELLIVNDQLSGAFNLASPNPIPNREFMALLRSAWGTKIGLPAYEWMLEIGALLLGTESELVLKSRRVVPSRLLEAGFHFDFPEWGQSAIDLCSQVKPLDTKKSLVKRG
jgi:uncharacterized protein